MEIVENITRVQVYGFILLIIGLVLRYWIARRRFNRITQYGTTAYKSYEHKVFLAWENFVKLFGGILLIGGLFLIIIEWFNHR